MKAPSAGEPCDHLRRYPERPAFYLQLDGGKSALIPLGVLTELVPPGGGTGAPVF